jgi:transposase
MPSRNGAVHVAVTTRTCNGKTYTTYLLRRTYREGGKVKHQTLGNISHLPPDLIDRIRRRLQGGSPESDGNFQIARSLPHGHVAAILGTLSNIGLDQLIGSRDSRERKLVIAMLAARLITPRSKLATSRGLREETATTSLALELGLNDVSENDLYKALDWLLQRQSRIENKLAKKHLRDGTLVLYDVSSSYYTGTHCTLAKFGHPRDGKNGYPQIVYGLLCNAEGCPIAIEVFEGNTGDPKTLSTQITKIRRRFHIQRVVMVGDRGMLTSKRIEEELRPVEGLDWITALRAESIKTLVEQRVIQRSFFDERDLVEVISPDYPDERLIVCRNPLLAEERARKREELLRATERKLDKIVAATARRRCPYHGKAKIALRVGKVIDKYKVGKHFVLDIQEKSFSYRRDQTKISEEATLDGLYVIRTSVAAKHMDSVASVRAYKDLSKVERAFRCLKTIDLKVRPIFHWLAGRVRSHVFLCMLAYYLEWHMRDKLKPILFDDHDREAAEQERPSIVAPAPRSEAAQSKDLTKQTADRRPVQSFQQLISDLGTLCKNLIHLNGDTNAEFYMLTTPTEHQKHALELLGVTP